MRRAGQTPHGARPNREGIRRKLEACRLGAPQPPGRSLELRSNAWPRGMTVPSQDGQNSAYRSGCHKLCSGERSLGFARDFGSGLPLRSRPLSASTYRSGCHLYRLLGILRFAQDFGSALPLRSRPLSASTYEISIYFLLSDPGFFLMSLSSLDRGHPEMSKSVLGRFWRPAHASLLRFWNDSRVAWGWCQRWPSQCVYDEKRWVGVGCNGRGRHDGGRQEVEIPALCLRKTQTQGRGTLRS